MSSPIGWLIGFGIFIALEALVLLGHYLWCEWSDRKHAHQTVAAWDRFVEAQKETTR